VQEEPENMGAYHFLHGRLHAALPKGLDFSHVAREESGAPATGSATVHEAEQRQLIDAAFEGL
jgi:2-oxoglutarate decarboxylase